jgi:hypothetical protein
VRRQGRVEGAAQFRPNSHGSSRRRPRRRAGTDLATLTRKEIFMQPNAIDATLNQLVNELPKSLGRTNGGPDFQAIIETLKQQIVTAIDQAARGALAGTAPGTTTTTPTAPAPTTPANAHTTTKTTSQLTPSQQSLLRSAGNAPLYELLPMDLTAGHSLYNERETLMRQELNVDGIEQQLKSKASALGVEYDRSDLEGILRNSGYDATHLGATERYMTAVQRFIGEAENNYRQRSTNTPDSRA